MKKLLGSSAELSVREIIVEFRLLRYVDAGNPKPSGFRSGDRAGRELLLDEDSVRPCGARGRGESSVAVSESGSTRSLENALGGIALGGNAGKDFSVTIGEWSFSLDLAAAAALDFFLRLAIRVSWQFIQKIP